MKQDLALPTPGMAEPIGRKGPVRLGEKPVLPPPQKSLEWSPDSPLPAAPEPVHVAPQKVAVNASVSAQLTVEKQAVPTPVAAPKVEVVLAVESLADMKKKPIKAKKSRSLESFDDECAVVAMDPRRHSSG